MAGTSQLSPVAADAVDDHVAVREMIDRVAQVSETARERMDRLGESDAVSHDVPIDVDRKLEEQPWMLRAQLSSRA